MFCAYNFFCTWPHTFVYFDGIPLTESIKGSNFTIGYKGPEKTNSHYFDTVFQCDPFGWSFTNQLTILIGLFEPSKDEESNLQKNKNDKKL